MFAITTDLRLSVTYFRSTFITYEGGKKSTCDMVYPCCYRPNNSISLVVPSERTQGPGMEIFYIRA